MHWHYYSNRYPKTFEAFNRWYEEKYPDEYKSYSLQDYPTSRLCEYCGEKGYSLEVKQGENLCWDILVNGQMISRYKNEADAFLTGIYHVSGLQEDTSRSVEAG